MVGSASLAERIRSAEQTATRNVAGIVPLNSRWGISFIETGVVIPYAYSLTHLLFDHDQRSSSQRNCEICFFTCFTITAHRALILIGIMSVRLIYS